MNEKEEVRERLDVVDILGEYLKLKGAGQGAFKALCPFHGEKTPSLHISRPKQIWHCFGCGKGGDIFAFVMEMEGMGFREALEHLAQKAGVVLQERPAATSTDRGDRLRAINAFAMAVYQKYLASASGEVARAYLAKRGLKAETIEAFGLGYAPKEWTVLVEAGKKKGIGVKELVEAGLASLSKGPEGAVDRFRHRLMIPLRDAQGRVVAFTGRVLDPKDEPKYMNSPQTPIYDKSRLLFGLDRAKTAIRREKSAVIVEGNMDVIASHEAGVEHVIACSGTAFTIEHGQALKRYTQKLVFCFDADTAGFEAARRAMRLAATLGFDIAVVPLSASVGKDPDEVIRSQGAEAWHRLVAAAEPRMHWLFNRLIRPISPDQIEAKKIASSAFGEEIATLPNAIEREHWISQMANMFGVSVQAATQSVTQAIKAQRQKSSSFLQRSQIIEDAPLNSDSSIQSSSRAEAKQSRYDIDSFVGTSTPPRNDVSPTPTPAERIAWLVLSLAWNDRESGALLIEQGNEELFPASVRELYNATVLVYHQSKFTPSLYGFEAIRAQFPSPEADTTLRQIALEAERVHGAERLPSGAFPSSLIISALKRLSLFALNDRKQSLLLAIRRAETAGDKEQVNQLVQQYQHLMSSMPSSL